MTLYHCLEPTQRVFDLETITASVHLAVHRAGQEDLSGHVVHGVPMDDRRGSGKIFAWSIQHRRPAESTLGTSTEVSAFNTLMNISLCRLSRLLRVLHTFIMKRMSCTETSAV